MKALLSPMVLMALLSAMQPVSAEAGPVLHDFARMLPLSLDPGGALYELSLPAEIYTGVQRSDLGDVAVFNGAGEIVPFALVPPRYGESSVAGRHLPLFPLAGTPPSSGGNLALRLRTDGRGASVDLRTTPTAGERGAASSYVVDASSLDRPVSGFDLDLSAGVEFIGTVRVAVSDDLQTWRDHGSGALVALSAAGERLQRSRIDFPAVTSRYFRLHVSPEQGAPSLTTVTARLATSPLAPPRLSTRFFLSPLRGEPCDYLVRTSGPLPVDRLRLVFDTDNSLATVSLYSRRDESSPWCERGVASFYRLRHGGGVVESPPLEIPPVADREWLVRVRSGGDGFGGCPPMLETGWLPARLVFAARGEPPYRLAFGSARTGTDQLGDAAIATPLDSWEQRGIRPLPATAGSSVEAGGSQALHRRISATTWKTSLLWCALVLGVSLLGQMAWRLSREMGKKKSP